MLDKNSILPQDFAVQSLLNLLQKEKPFHHGWFGSVGVRYEIQDGDIKLVRKLCEETEKREGA